MSSTTAAMMHLERTAAAIGSRALPHRHAIVYARTIVEVFADTPAVGGHLQEILGTHMRVTEAASPAEPSGRIVAVAGAADGPSIDAVSCGDPVDIFPLRDSFMTMTGAALAAGGVQWIWNAKTNSLIRRADGSRDFLILGPAKERERHDPLLGASLQQDTLRVARDIILFNEQSRGAVVFHAGAVERGGVGTAIVCERGGGKTTFLSKLLDAPRSARHFVSGDRLIVAADEDVAWGWPGYTSIGLRTVVDVPRLHPLLDEPSRFALERPLSESESRRKVTVTHHVYQAALGFEVVPSARLGRLIFPVPETTGLAPSRLAACDARALLAQNITDLMVTEEADWLKLQALPADAREQAILRAAAAVADCTPAYRLGTPDIAAASGGALDSYLAALEAADGR